MRISAKQQPSLLKFTSIIASSLTKASKAVKSVGRPSKRSLDHSNVTTPSPKRLYQLQMCVMIMLVTGLSVGMTNESVDSVKLDKAMYFVLNATFVYFLNARNCFLEFHSK